jgi:hypothetical protein
MQVHDAGDGDKLVTISIDELTRAISSDLVHGADPAGFQVENATWNEAADKVYILLSAGNRDASRSGSIVDRDPMYPWNPA